MKLPGSDGTLVRVVVENFIEIDTDDGVKYLIEENSTYLSDGNTATVIELPASGSDMNSLVGIEGLRIESSICSDTGALTITFSDGSVLSVPPSPDFESWKVSAPGNVLVVSTPGGSIAAWNWPELETS